MIRRMRQLFKRFSWLAACLLFLCTACLSKKDYSEEEVQVLMNQELNRRLLEYRKVKIKACYDEAFQAATHIADSLLIEQAYFERDTLSRPPKPIKPTEGIPEVKGPDTIALKPLFEGKKKKIKMDTLGKKNKGVR
jgi:hypothetical protein